MRVLNGLLLVGLTGCAGELLKPVDLSDADRSEVEASGNVTVTMQNTPGFLFGIPSSALVDAGAADWLDPLNAPTWPRITQIHNVPDFTDTVRERLLEGLSVDVPELNFSTIDERQPYRTKLETAYVRQYPTTYVLGVRSQYGSFRYGPLAWGTSLLNYSAQARLIRTSDELVVWKATCQVPAKDHNELKVPAADFLVEDGSMLRKAADFSTNECARQLLAAYSPP